MALRIWHGRRAERLDELLDVHARVLEIGRGHTVGARQLELALIQRLASEFQGFARDLHDEAVEEVRAQMAEWNPVWASIVERLMLSHRDLGRRNASPSTLASDFDRLGLKLWPNLMTRDARNARWHRQLERLNRARNAITHDDLANLRQHGDTITLDLVSFWEWRSAADQVAVAMDVVVAKHLAEVLDSRVPW